ncbi:MarR family transcriptional regulator [Desulfosporosinus sp. PR]|uniref:MarR family transcriptional regulator n=1 Tax=Candidatus Desulfosporosinus nitrosoreducens TaxID=3401928 RepID=UPI0027EE05C1|nr:MarR family transcriptional regulator [Desulfosporosinus sp. PR]MDQ7097072.1 MarR family transcriptional regulator [Desulfosporosinus sp. PR]
MNNAPAREITVIINKLVSFFDLINDYAESHEKSFTDLLSQSDKHDYKFILTKNLMLSEIHVIDCIGKRQLPNATFIAKELSMTKGAISKITSKLLEKELIKANHLEDNRKEIYYTLTAPGKKIYEIHKQLHDLENERIIAILTQYGKDELQVIGNFLDDLLTKL